MRSLRGWVRVPTRRFSDLLTICAIGLLIVPAGLVDLPRRAQLGPFSLLAWLTIVQAVVTGAAGVAHLKGIIRWATRLWPLTAFCAWQLLSFTWYHVSVASLQNVLVSFLFLLVICVVTEAFEQGSAFERVAERAMWIATGIATAIYSVILVRDGLGASAGITNRPFALFALVALSWTLSGARIGSRPAAIMSVLLIVLILLSLSRVALAVGVVVLIPVALSRLGGWTRRLRTLAVIASCIGLFAGAVLFFGPLHERFVTGDVKAIGGLKINVTGRFSAWDVVWDSYVDSPVVGHGAGSSDDLVAARIETLGHAHNDYLRILHDYGLIGLCLWLAGYLFLLVRVGVGWRKSVPASRSGLRWHLAAFLGLLTIGLTITSNTMIYTFVMNVVAILVGVSLGVAERRDSPEQQLESSVAPSPGR